MLLFFLSSAESLLLLIKALSESNTAYYHANPPATEKHSHAGLQVHTQTQSQMASFVVGGALTGIIMVIYVWI